MRKILLNFLLSIASIEQSFAFDGTTTRAMLALTASPLTACSGLDVAWTPQYASIKGYYRFDGALGNVTDGSTVAATIGSSGLHRNANGTGMQYVDGVHSAGISLDGVDDFVSVSYNTALKPSIITVALWVKVNTIASGKTAVMVSKWQGGGYILYFTAARLPAFAIESSGVKYYATSSTAVEFGNWNHYVGTHDGTTTKLYVNGKLVASTPAPGLITYPENNAFCIGKDASDTNTSCNASTPRMLNGMVDEVAVWNTALTDSEVKKLYERSGCTF